MKTTKNIRNLVFFFAIIFTSFCACKKTSTKTSVSGVVVNTGSTTPVAGALVELMQTDANCFTCPASLFLTTTSGANGAFNFDFDAKPDFNYTVKASKKLYYSNASSGGVAVSNGTANNITVAITPYAWLKLYVKNVSPFDGGDLLSVGAGTGGSGVNFYGTTVDSTLVFKAFGNSDNTVMWTVIKNNNRTDSNIKIYCPAFDTTAYSINY